MNAKLVMEITVTEFGSPLLYDRLNACGTPRERAAVFKACAEAHLRAGLSRGISAPDRHTVYGSRSDAPATESSHHETSAPGPTEPARQTASSSTAPTASPTANANAPGVGFQALRTESPRDMSGELGNAMGNGLADFY